MSVASLAAPPIGSGRFIMVPRWLGSAAAVLLLLVAVWSVAACGFQSPNELGDTPGGVGNGMDASAAPGDSTSSPPDGAAGCAWATHFDACQLPSPPPSVPLVLSAPTRWHFDTRTGTFGVPSPPATTYVVKALPQTGAGPEVVVLYTSAFTLTFGAVLDVTGDRPLVIAADSTISVAGALNAGSQSGNVGPANVGPGVTRTGCSSALDGSGSGSGDGGGGGGGALAASGGAGADGNGNNGGDAGALVAMPAFIRGGCGGGVGGRNGGGSGGSGGGGIELAARTSIAVSGTINAGGGGGDGAGRNRQRGGGGGGGSGGIISFEAPSVVLFPGSIVAANGGGGGGGASEESMAGAGDDGSIAGTNAGGGGSEDDHIGGHGGATNPVAGGAGIGGGDGGGGGGGGSSGYIMVRAATFSTGGAVVSPAATRR